MCNLWKSRERDALQPRHMGRLPTGLTTINLSGGEPFLRADLPEFVREAHRRCPGAQITISTNAYLPDRIDETMAEILRIDPAVRLAISLDGIGPIHDRIRGDQGAFQHAMTLIDRLTSGGYRGLRLGMTLSRDNVDQLLAVAKLASEKCLELGVVAAHPARTHLGVDELPPAAPEPLPESFGPVVKAWLRSGRPKQWLRAHFAWNTYRYLAGRRWRFRCHAGDDFFFLQADGTVFSCSVQGRALGNLVQQEWGEIWRGPAAAQARALVRQCPESCWMVCTARSVYRARPAGVIGWILTHKPLAHLGRLRLPEPRPAPDDENRETNVADPAR